MNSKERRNLLLKFGLRCIQEEWSIFLVGEVLEEEKGISVGVMYPGKNCSNGGIPLIKAGDLKNNWINPEPDFAISREKHNEYIRTELEGGELLVSLVGNTGQTAIVPYKMKGWNVARAVAVIRLKENFSGKYIQYLLQSYPLQCIMKAWCNTTVQETLNLKEIRQLPLPLPNRYKQEAIANILGTLDEKIEINKKTNKTLEEIANALFKSWFIDFDPVRARSLGRSTGLPNVISALFPDSYEQFAQDQIPTGWRKKNFGDFVIPKRGKIITKNTVREGIIPVVAGGINPSYFHNKHNVEGPVVTISGSGANAGFVNLYFDNIWASDCSYVSKIESKNIFTTYLFLKTFQKKIFDSQHGAAQPHVNPNDLMRLEFIIPNLNVFDKFEYLVNPIFQKIHINNQAKKNLKIMKDILLPRLISGELKICDAEKIIEEVEI